MLRETQTKQDHATLVGNIFLDAFIWLLLLGIGSAVLDREDSAPRSSPRQRIAAPARAVSGALVYLGSLSACHFWRAFRMGYDTMRDVELKQKVRRDLYSPHPGRNVFMAANGLHFILVPLMAVLLTYLEVWPERAIAAVFGDPSRFWEYHPGNPTSNRRLP